MDIQNQKSDDEEPSVVPHMMNKDSKKAKIVDKVEPESGRPAIPIIKDRQSV